MVRKCLAVLFLICCASIIWADIAPAEVKGDYGASFRLRQEYWENVMDFETLNKPDRDFFRLRSSLWGKVDFNQNFGIYGKITNEARYYLGNYKPFEITSPPAGVPYSDDDRFDEDELVVDNLYFDMKNLFGLPVDMRIGRQDFMGQYGEGFLIGDGTPGDGSRTNYFNAIKATWRINKDNSVDLVYLNNTQTDHLPNLHPARSDYLPNYLDNEKVLNISDEWGFILYGKNKLNDNFSIEPYYIFKHEDAVGHEYREHIASGGPNVALDLNTVGARAVLTAANWKVRAEYAHQFGEYDNDRDREANGGYIFIGQKFNDVSYKPEWELGYVFLSGDDNPENSTGDHEGWDPLFSRNASWNEVFIYTLVYETSGDGGAIPGYWTNMQLAKLGLKLTLDSATNLALSYQHLWADEETNVTASSVKNMFSNDSKDRGHIVTAMLSHTFTKQIDGFFQLEYFAPGDFYADNADDAIFARWQLQYKF
jgi:hypothetical protein